MKWQDALIPIQEAIDTNKLVIFVGAGVSQNSGIPVWNSIIEELKKLLENELESFRKEDFAFLSNLEIAQLAKEKNEIKYKEIISNSINIDVFPNEIDEIIFNLLPSHIITTNLDDLLEKVENFSRQYYSIIVSDKDIFKSSTNRFLIKIHGDISDFNSWVFTQKEYLDFHETRPLISNLLKSLLATHTFLFIGYSLQDPDFQQLLSWIRLNKEKNNISDSVGPDYFFINSNANKKDYLKDILLEKDGIQSVYLDNTLLLDNEQKPFTILNNPIGKKLYNFLDCFTNNSNLFNYYDLNNIYQVRYKQLNYYDFISFQDLFSIHSFEVYNLIDNTLYLYLEDKYDDLKNFLKSDELFKRVFLKAGINKIKCLKNGKEYQLQGELTYFEDPYLILTLNNQYIELKIRIDNDTMLKESKHLYFNYLFNTLNSSAINDFRINIKSEENYLNRLIEFTRLFTLENPIVYKKKNENDKKIEKDFINKFLNSTNNSIDTFNKPTHFLEILLGLDFSNLYNLSDLRDKVKNDFLNEKTSNFGFDRLDIIRTFAYSYYFFFKLNYFAFDYKEASHIYLSYYTESLIISQSSLINKTENERKKIQKILSNSPTPYKLGILDIELLTKFTKPRNLQSWINLYKIENLKLQDNIDISTLFSNLCESYIEFNVFFWVEYFKNYSILLNYFTLNDHQIRIIYKSIIKLLKKSFNYYLEINRILLSIIDDLFFKYKIYEKDQFVDENLSLLKIIVENYKIQLNLDFSNSDLKNFISGINNILSKLKSSINNLEDIEDFREFAITQLIISSNSKDYFQLFREFLTKDFIQNYLKENKNQFSSDELRDFIYLDYLLYEDLEEIFLSRVKTIQNTSIYKEESVLEKEKDDELSIILSLYLNDYNVNIKKFFFNIQYNPYSRMYNYFKFLNNPLEFDLNLIDLKDNIWKKLLEKNASSDLYEKLFNFLTKK